MYFIIILLLSLFSPVANAVDIPLDFLYKNKLIDPNCILESNTSHTIDLAECSEHKGKSITGYIIKDDSYGYKYIDEKNSFFPGSIMYKYLGKIGDWHVVFASVIDGEIGRLNYINYFKLEKGILKLVKRGPSGDRSFGGILNPTLQYGVLTYDMVLTPKLFMLNFSKDESLKPYFESLPDCAVCQFAKVTYKNDNKKSVTLNSVLIEGEKNDTTKCLNKIHKKYIDHNKLELTIKETERFVDKFIKECTN